MPGPGWAPEAAPLAGGLSGRGSSPGTVGSASRKASVSAGGQGHCATVGPDGAWPARAGRPASIIISCAWDMSHCAVPSPTLAMWTPREMASVRSAGLPGRSARPALNLASPFQSSGQTPPPPTWEPA